MLQYKNHRFHYGRISFQIPEGFFLDSCPELLSDNAIHLYAPDESFALELTFMECSKGSGLGLVSEIHAMESTSVYFIEPITVSGLSGHHAAYVTEGVQYYEARLDIEESVAFVLTVVTEGDIQDIDVAAVVAAVDLRNRSE